MAGGLQIFSIDPPDNKETASTEKELELLEQVWLGYPNPLTLGLTLTLTLILTLTLALMLTL